ncbi:MAG: 50S ribosomal protein L3 N(5)-glutamine methyltransferase [Gammaproteobacteria bacterium]|nr:50S ribosomal protein L3 N(5)-glutamine methyltransferase [Gammaproteobacteria bacterium]
MTTDPFHLPEPFQSAARELATVADFIRWGASRLNEAGVFFGHGTDNALDEAAALVLHALHLDPAPPVEVFGARLTEAEKGTVLGLLRRRVEDRVPLPYLTHEAWFAGLPFYVDERVLVPRSPIAELIETGFEPWVAGDEVKAVLEIGTGSGCIAIACAMAFPHARVDATDISDQSLDVALENVKRHGLVERVHLHRADVFQGLEPAAGYDIIVSNPPYVDRRELRRMPAEYRREPLLGLEAGEDGLDVVRRILEGAPRFLAPGGILVVEVGASRPALEAAYPNLPFYWPDFERGGEGVFILEAAAISGTVY